jgi:hypothetical protein
MKVRMPFRIQKTSVACKDIERLCRLGDEGKASGSAEALDFSELRAEARQRLEKVRAAQ